MLLGGLPLLDAVLLEPWGVRALDFAAPATSCAPSLQGKSLLGPSSRWRSRGIYGEVAVVQQQLHVVDLLVRPSLSSPCRRLVV
eukprot:1903939-Amphidinium_carterae.1